METQTNVRGFGYDSAPAGTVVAFAGMIASEKDCGTDALPVVDIESMGWMDCDGRWLLAAQYSDLHGAIGFLYGERDSDKGKEFRIPDYRGMFLRGVDGGAGVDPDVKKRIAPKGEGWKPEYVGSSQEDAIQTHKHQYQEASSTTPGGDKGAAASPAAPGLTEPPADQSSEIPGDARVSSETRPKNIYVNYIIKINNNLKRRKENDTYSSI